MPPSSTNNTCYRANGAIATNDFSCEFPNISQCCAYGWDCLSNGLCRQPGTNGTAQGTCTDITYGNCLSICNPNQFDGFTWVARCQDDGNSWCCVGQGYFYNNCCKSNATSLEPYPFSIYSANTPQDAGVSTLASSSVSSGGTSKISISSGTILTSVTSSSLKSATPGAASTQPSATPFTTSPTLPSSHTSSQSHYSKASIEIGVPVAIAVVLLAALAFFIFRNRKLEQRLAQLRNQTGGDAQGREHTRSKTQVHEGSLAGELDVTHYEVARHDAPGRELLGNTIHEIHHNGISEHELAGTWLQSVK